MSYKPRARKLPLGHALRRMLWNMSWFFLFRPTPKKICRRWRNTLLKIFGAKIHGYPLIYPTCRIFEPWNLEVGDMAAISDRVNIYNHAKVIIHDRAVISQDTELCTGTHDYTKDSLPLISFPITIGKNAWVTSKCFVHPGVTIGEGAVIGACSVVTKDMPEWMVCAGHPCKPIKKREFKENE